MAISKTIILDSGITVPGAYIRIDTVAGYKGHMDAKGYVYVSRDAFLGEGVFTKPQSYVLGPVEFSFEPDVSEDSQGIFKQAYAALKGLPEYADAVDC